MPEPVVIDFEGNATDLLNEVKKVQAAMDKNAATLKEAGVSQAAYAQATQKTKMSLTDLRSGFMMVSDAVRVGQQAFDMTVGAAQAYDQQIKGVMASTGGTADSTSRLVQVLDDAGIEFDTVKISLKEMSKDGVAPTVDELARLSDKFLSITDPAEKGKFLLDTFGKSGTNMARAMELGGDALRKMNSEMSGGLILTQQSIDASEQYRKNMDEFADTVNGVKVSIGNGLIPQINEAVDIQKTWAETYDEVAAATGNTDHRTLVMLTNLAVANEERYKAIELTKSHADALDGDLVPAIDNSISVMEGLTVATADVSKANTDYLSIIGNLTTSEQQLAEKTAEINQQYADGKITLEERGAALDELAAKQEEASQRMIQSMLQEVLAADGLTTAEMQFLLQRGEAQGIYSASAVESANIALQKVAELNAAFNTLPTQRTFTMSVLVQGADAVGGLGAGFGASQWGGGGKKKHAAGGSFLIPSSYGNEGFAMGNGDTASAGETVTISPKGSAPDNSALIAAISANRIDEGRLARSIVSAMTRLGGG